MVSLKPIYTASTEDATLEELNLFETVWGEKHPLIVRSWRQNGPESRLSLSTHSKIRKIFYTTNTIESYHRQLRKVTKSKSIFPSDEALLKMLYLATQDILRKRTGRVRNWGLYFFSFQYFP